MPDPEAPGGVPADPPLAVASAVSALAGVRRGHVLADLASGVGRWTRPAAAAATSAGRVLAFSAAVAAYGDSPTRAADPAWAPIHRCLARPDALPLPAGSLDGALWVTDPTRPREDDDADVLAELRRVLRPGCRAVLSFPGSSATAPMWLLAEQGFGVAHVAEERWADVPLTLVAVRRG